MPLTAASALRAMKMQADPVRAASSHRYLQAHPGGYGEGDRFIGLTASQIAAVAREFSALSLAEVDRLLCNDIHEVRSVALAIMVWRYARGDEAERARVFALYLKRLRYINNWDLIDGSAPTIVGGHLHAHPDAALIRKLSMSKSIW